MRTPKLLLTLLFVAALKLTGWTAIPVTAVDPGQGYNQVEKKRPDSRELERISQMKLFAGMTVEQYGKWRGKKLNFLERAAFKMSQRRMKKMLKYYEYGDGPTTLQKIGWLIKGLLFGPLALILGYIFLKDDDRELIKWIWFGFAGFAVIVALVLLAGI